MSMSRQLADELNTRALRHAVWLSVYLAQTLGLDEIAHRLTATLVEVDARLDMVASR